MALRRQAVIVALALAATPCLYRGEAHGFADAFFDSLPKNADKLIAECVDRADCASLGSLNQGLQYFTLKVRQRVVSSSLLAEAVRGDLVVDAGELEQLLADFYLWPKEVSRLGRVRMNGLPGLDVRREGLAIDVTPRADFVPARQIGGYRVVRPEEFTIPGFAIFGDVNASFESDFGSKWDDSPYRARVGSEFGAQAGLWQFRSNAAFDTHDNEFRVDYAYVERPLLSQAMRFRGGYMEAEPGCAQCVAGDILGVMLETDSLGGLLFDRPDTVSLELDFEGDIDQIEIVVNGRVVDRESVFPGRQSISVSGLEDGLNSIEIYGLDRESGIRRLIHSTTQTASVAMLGPSMTESRLQVGVALSDSYYRYGHDVEFESPFLQFEQRRGLGDGLELELATIVSPDGVLGEAGVTFGIGAGRATISGIGSFAGEPGIGLGLQVSQRLYGFSLAASGQACFDCFNAATFELEEGMSGWGTVSLSTRLFDWSAVGALTYSSYRSDEVEWRASLSRNLWGGRLTAFANNHVSFEEGDLSFDEGLQFGIEFTRSFGGDRRLRTASVGMTGYSDSAYLGGSFRDNPIDGDGVSAWGALNRIDSGVFSDGPASVAGMGYEDENILGAVNLISNDGNKTARVDLASGFVVADGEFVAARNIRSGGIFAAGVESDASIQVNGRNAGESDSFGQTHLRTSTQGKPLRIEIAEGLEGSGTFVSREEILLPVPGAFYGMGEEHRRYERSYRIVSAESSRPISPGVLLRAASGEVVGISGYDGLVTISGRSGAVSFTDQGLLCQTSFAGNEVADDTGLASITATCEGTSTPD